MKSGVDMAAEHKGYTVLIVDDDEGLCRLIQNDLQQTGVHAHFALNGADAIAYVSKNSDVLLLLDYRLPDMTARHVIDTLQQHQPGVPFIIMTGYGDERMAVDMMKLGACDYLVKDRELLGLLPAVVAQVIEQLETERKLMEAERKLRDSMVEKRLMRSEKLAYIGRLSANFVHELRNPLDGTIRYLKMLLDQMPGDDKGRMYAEQAMDGLSRMANMVSGLSDFAWKSRQVLRPANIQKSIEYILYSCSDQITASGIKVETEFDGKISVTFNEDVSYIFENIIKNAVQAMPDGGTLSIKAKLAAPQVLEARFSDTGPGIPDEIQDRIFEPFFTTKDAGQGVGLGLSISQGIAESYNGSIAVENGADGGTTFIVRLPVSENGLTINEDLRWKQL